MELENLLKQQELLQVQISDVKTKDVRAEITSLEEDLRELREQYTIAKEFKKTADIEIGKQIDELKRQIQELTNLSLENAGKVFRIDREIQRVSYNFTEKEKELKSLLS